MNDELIRVDHTVETVKPATIRTHWATTEGPSDHDSGAAMDFVRDQLEKEEKYDIVKKMSTLLQQNAGSEKIKEVVKKVHFMSYDAHGSKGSGVYCSCGMYKLHTRGKVLAVWADKHYEKYGHFWKRT